MSNNQQLQLPKSILPIIFLVILGIIFISKSTVNIDAGEAGVLWKRFGGGVVTDKPPLGEGFHIVAPWNTVTVYDVRQQELFEKMKVLGRENLSETNQSKDTNNLNHTKMVTRSTFLRMTSGQINPVVLMGGKLKDLMKSGAGNGRVPYG